MSAELHPNVVANLVDRRRTTAVRAESLGKAIESVIRRDRPSCLMWERRIYVWKDRHGTLRVGTRCIQRAVWECVAHTDRPLDVYGFALLVLAVCEAKYR